MEHDYICYAKTSLPCLCPECVWEKATVEAIERENKPEDR